MRKLQHTVSLPAERELWIRSLPNVLTCKISKNIGVCEKHFPPDCPRIKKPGGRLVPAVPPSSFGDTMQSVRSNSYSFACT